MKTIEINYGNKATINTGNYENVNPFYSMKVILENPTDEEISSELNKIKLKVNAQLDEEVALIKSPKDDCSKHRFTFEDGIKFPHVTNIITPDELTIPDIDLHAKVGKFLDWSCKQFAIDGVLAYPCDIDLEGKWLDMFNECYQSMKKQLGKVDFEFVDVGTKVFNYEHLYCGELDATAKKGKMNIITDFKKSKNPNKAIVEKYLMQLSAYAKCFDDFFSEMVIITPFQKPIVSDEIDKYFELFLKKREEYKERFGV